MVYHIRFLKILYSFVKWLQKFSAISFFYYRILLIRYFYVAYFRCKVGLPSPYKTGFLFQICGGLIFFLQEMFHFLKFKNFLKC